MLKLIYSACKNINTTWTCESLSGYPNLNLLQVKSYICPILKVTPGENQPDYPDLFSEQLLQQFVLTENMESFKFGMQDFHHHIVPLNILEH